MITSLSRLLSIRLALRVLLAGATLLVGMGCYAGDNQASRSCRDNSVPVADTQTIGSGSQTQDAVVRARPRSVKLSWNASVPASAMPKDAVAGYNIFRSELGKDCLREASACNKINQTLILGTSCTDYAVEAGRTYIYKAQAVSVRNVNSKLSNDAKATLP
jgi:hypothetical protein